MQSNINLHYVYDPLCGWCYAIAPLLNEIATISALKIHLHGGGLWVGDRRQQMGPDVLAYVKPHDMKIAALSGQTFGEDYFNKLLVDSSLTMDSEPPIKAVLAIEALGGDSLTAMHSIQDLHYQKGQWTGDINLLSSVAEKQNITTDDFLKAYQQVNFVEHTQKSNMLKVQLGGQGYPTLGIEKPGQLHPINTSLFIGKPSAFKEHLLQIM